jgi:hypothetical protein
MHHLEFFTEWTVANGQTVIIDNLKYKIRVSTFRATFPYPFTAITVDAEPVSKTSAHYIEVRKALQDDWSIDLLDPYLDVDTFVSVCEQVGIYQEEDEVSTRD